MTHVVPDGNRRIDRVLAEDFLADLPDLPLAELRALRAEAEQEETDLSYLRRLLQGRLDIARAEHARRSGDARATERRLVADLPRILAEEERAPARGLGRHSAVEPSRTDSQRRYVERLVADTGLSDVTGLDTETLAAVVERFDEEERAVSTVRRAVQRVMDACSAEVARRYRDGEADVDTLLSGGDAR